MSKSFVENHEPVSLDPITTKIKSSFGTSSVGSESSLNSQGALLRRTLARTKPNKVQGKNFFTTFCCKCVCSDKESLDSNEYNATENKFSKKTSFGEVQLNGAITKQPLRTSLDIAQITKPLSESWVRNNTPYKLKQEEKMRKSLDVFGSDSDESSDLFEIESFTNRKNPFLARQVSSGCAPSEASIEWSVVTASVAEYSEDFRSVSEKNVINKEGPWGRPGSILGCKSYKAVRVAGDSYRTNCDSRMQHS